MKYSASILACFWAVHRGSAFLLPGNKYAEVFIRLTAKRVDINDGWSREI